MKVNLSSRLQNVAHTKVKKRFSELVSKVVRDYIGKPEKIKNLPRAPYGSAKVYFIDKPFLVLKKSKSHRNRIIKMQKARKICRENYYTHLIIPNACNRESFIVESRLPIIYQNTKEQIGCYIEHKELFTEAIEQFTKFLCQTQLEDITWGAMDPYQALSNSPIGRYDNISLYITKGKGKLGLIDLEEFYSVRPDFESSQQEGEWYFKQCRKAICLFPYHFEVIIASVKEFYSNIEIYLQGLEKVEHDTIDFFQRIYENHLKFIKNNNISLKNPSKPVIVSTNRKEEIKKIIVSLVLQEQNDPLSKNQGFLGEESDKVISSFQESFSEILDLITGLLSKEIQKKTHQQTIESFIKLVSHRTVRLNNQDLHNKIMNLLKVKSGWDSYKKRDFVYFIINYIFKHLVEGEEIAYYEPYFGFDICVFC